MITCARSAPDLPAALADGAHHYHPEAGDADHEPERQIPLHELEELHVGAHDLLHQGAVGARLHAAGHQLGL
jgi:hypothetical protein